MDPATAKREIAAGRWPFEAPLNVECSCKNCQERIEVGLASDYEPKWTRAARIRWLEAQEDVAAQTRNGSTSTNTSAGTTKLPRSTSRTAIQADEVAQLHNETVHPMTAAELAEEPTSPTFERTESGLSTTLSEANGQATKPLNPNGLEEGDDTLRREIIARRQRMARQSPVLRHGARSMMRQLEEAERIEQEAARSRSQSRDRGGHLAPGSGRSSPASPAMSPSLPSTPETVSTTPPLPQERCDHAGQTATVGPSTSSSSSYFDMAVQPPERVRSPLIPAHVVSNNNNKPLRLVRSAAVPSESTTAAGTAAFAMNNVVESLEAALGSPTASPITEGSM